MSLLRRADRLSRLTGTLKASVSDNPNISYQPTDALCYDPAEARYWDAAGLRKELVRVFEICHGCRMCFKYCDAFPTLFSLLDQKYDGDVRRVTPADTRRVMDLCFQCKLCEVQCPYTPREQHAFQLDFPKLVHREKAIRRRREGGSLRDRVLGDPDGAGRMARASLGLANVLNRSAAHRLFFEKLLGVHRDKTLPDFASETFEAWADKTGRIAKAPRGEVALFQTCYVQNNEPDIGKDTVFVLEKNGVAVDCLKGLVCCGMPKWEHGDIDGLRVQARRNLDVLSRSVDAGQKVLAINPTCSMMLRREYPELVDAHDRERARRLAAAVMDPAEFLWSIRNEPRFSRDFKSSPGGTLAYHAPCHLRAQAVGFKGRDLLRLIPGVKPAMVMECCGHDGTFAMKLEGFEASQRVGAKAFQGARDAQADVWSTDCPLAALQFGQHAGRKPMHPMTILRRAYEPDGFAQKVEPPPRDPGEQKG